MATQPPFLFADRPFAAPPWVVDEVQQRMVLLLNHVIGQEPEAGARLARLKGRLIEARWSAFMLRVAITPAGLLERAGVDNAADLVLTVVDESPLAILQAALRGDKPTVRIEGDVQLAAEVNWLVEHLRWDMEDDLARLVGDVPAHAIAEAARRVADALRRFAGAPPSDKAAP